MNSAEYISMTEEQRREMISRSTATRKKVRQCEHIKTNGEFCGSPALRGRNYCYFHLTHIGRRIRAERVHAIAVANSLDSSVVPLELPPLEDANSIQIALMQVVDAILHNRLDTKRAGLVLYALQTASSNLARGADFEQTNSATVAAGYDDFEEDFELDEDAPELHAEEEDDEDERAAEIAHIEKMAEAYAKVDIAKEKAYEERMRLGIPEANDESTFHCDEVSQFFCSIMGPLVNANKSCTGPARRRERDAASQRLELLSVYSLREDEEDLDLAEEEESVA